MSDVFEYDDKVLYGPQETRGQFSGVGDDARMGIEVEYQFTRADGTDFPITLPEYTALEGKALSMSIDISKEVTAQMAEIKTEAHQFQFFYKLKDEFNAQARGIKQAATELGFKCNEQPNLQEIVFPELLKQAHPRDRAQVFLRQFEERGPRELARYCTTTSGFQVSVSYKDEEHGYQLYKRAVYLAPLMATLLANGENYTRDDEGFLKKTKKNLPLEQRLAAYGVGNSVNPGFWKADNATEFFDRVNQQHWDMNMFCVMEPHESEAGKGQLTYVENEGDIKPFGKLGDDKRHFTNFNLVSSMQWYLVSLSWLPLPSKDGAPNVKRRIEWRGLDTLPEHLVMATTRFIGALSFDEEFGAKVDDIIRNSGFNLENPAASRNLWLDSVRAAVKSHAKPYETSYGKVTAGAAASAIKDLCREYEGQYPELKDLADLFETGKTPSQLRQQSFNLESISKYLKASVPVKGGLKLWKTMS
jgi:hypothetical protein